MRREILSSLLIGSLVVFGLAAAVGVIFYAFPPPSYEEIGTPSDYPPSSEPYLVAGKISFYLVSTKDEMVALSSRSPRKAGCWIDWSREDKIFIEPCFGTRFKLDGTYKSGPPMNMDRYPLKLDGEKLLVETGWIIRIPYDDSQR